MSTDANTALQSVDQLTRDLISSILNRCTQYRMAMGPILCSDTLQGDSPEAHEALCYTLLNTSCVDMIEAATHHLERINTLTIQESLKP